MKFAILADYLAQLEATASRNQITEILSVLLKKATDKEVDKICYLCLGQLAPLYAGVEFNLAEKLMIKVLSRAFKTSEEKVKQAYKRLGDLGEIGEKLKVGQGKEDLSVEEVYQKLQAIAQEQGGGSVERKINQMATLLNQLKPLAVRYVVRIPLGKLRLGFSELTILDALSWMLTGSKSKRQEIEEAFNVRADIGQISQIIKKQGLKGLKNLKIQLGIPIVPALCQRLPNAEEMIKKMGQVAVEPKYDGTRLQIHWSRGKVGLFTRNLENVTLMFPDIVEALQKEIKAKEAIFDGEAIGFEPKTGKFLPFQETIKRKRKYQVDQKIKEIPLKYFAFDLLYKDGQDLLKTPFSQRREILAKTILPVSITIKVSPQMVTAKAQALRQFHDEQIKKGLEGIVAKKWAAPYDPGRRGYTWVKLKQERGKKGGGLADTLDCVVMGYYKGRGKRADFGIGGFLVGVREKEESEPFLTISKIGTGLSDEQWREMKKRIDEVQTLNQPKQYVVNKNLFPDVWCAPKIVVEIEADNITKSPVHTARLALRFPRLIQFRDDKSAKQATTLKEAEKLYKLQG
ncbi:ATP-dependent DNA ligase [Candidatus Shapirobacteria bacterium]|nr:ATP-dependent DNA ligase [Candidatus Shapirobacteria bacterium]